MNTASCWRLEVLGKPRLVRPDGQTLRPEGNGLALLTYLALEGPTLRSRLAGLLWPETPEGAARNNLVHLIRRIHRTYGEDLLHADDRVGLSEEVWVDASQLNGSQEDNAGETPPGTLLEEVHFDDRPDLADWLLAWRERLDNVRAERLGRTAARQEESGDLTGALVTTAQLLDFNPVSEEVYRRLMRLHYLSGDRGAALAAFERCRTVLQREFGTGPLPETLALAREVERGTPPAAALNRPRIPLSVLRPPSLIGREPEWARMEEAWEAGQFIILAGEGGMGKSRLARDFAASKGEVVVLEGRPGDALVPYATTTRNLRRVLARVPDLPLEPWMRSSLSRLLPELLDGAPAPTGPDARLHAAIHHVFRMGLAGVSAFVYDDLHLADPASIEAGFVLISSSFPLGQSGGVPRLIATVRPAELPAPTAEIFGQIVGAGHGVRLDLEPLAPEAVGTLLRDLDVPSVREMGPQLARFTGGNPLFLLETVKHLIESPRGDGALPVSARVSQLIEGRLAKLSPAALGAARGAAVLQSDVRIELVAAVLGAPLLDTAAAWEELEEAQVMSGEDFSHDLVRETVLAGIPQSVRRLLGRSTARMLEREGVRGARVARHWLEGGDDEKAAPHLLEAAELARRQGRLREAAAFCEQAADIFEARGSLDGAFEAVYTAMRLTVEISYQAELPRLGERLTGLARTPTQHARAYEARMHRLYEQGDWAGLEALSGTTLDRAREVGDRELQAVCHEALTAVTLFCGRLDEARDHLRQMAQIASELNHGSLHAITHIGLGRVEGFAHRRAALNHFEQALALYTDVSGDQTGQVSALAKMAVMWHELGLAPRALDAAQRAGEVLARLDVDSYYHLAQAHSTFLAQHALGDYRGALATLRGALNLPEQDQVWWRSLLHLDLARLFLTLGAADLARAEVITVEARADLQPLDVPHLLLLKAQTLARRGEEAGAVFDAALAQPGTRLNAYEHARLLLARGPTLSPTRALLDAETALVLAREDELGGVEIAALTRRAQAHLALGQLKQAAEDSAAATQLCAAFTPEFPLGEVLRTHEEVLEALGAPRAPEFRGAAATWLEQAVQNVPEEFQATFLEEYGRRRSPVGHEPAQVAKG